MLIVLQNLSRTTQMRLFILYGSLLYKEGANKTLKINAFSLYPLPIVPKGVA
jgi:hypothetical protein